MLQNIQNDESSTYSGLLNIKSRVFSYLGWEKDVYEAADAQVKGNKYGHDRRVKMILKKQQIHDGDRSHPRLVALDSTAATYPGSDRDKQNAEKHHLKWEDDTEFYNLLKGIVNKQRVYLGDRSHPNLVKLDRLATGLSYPDWEKDFKEAESKHYTGMDWGFERLYQKMKKKQEVLSHEDRSHPRLVALDGLKLSYPCWEIDFAKVEDSHYNWETGSDFWFILAEVVKKQNLHMGGRSHPNLVRLDKLLSQLTYPNWLMDYQKAEKAHSAGLNTSFERLYDKCERKQQIHSCCREARSKIPALKALDSLKLSYPKWEEDVHHAESLYCEWGDQIAFPEKIRRMKNKQSYHELLKEEEFSSETSVSCSSASTKGGKRQKYPPSTSPNISENEKRHKINIALLTCFSSQNKKVSLSVPHNVEDVAESRTDTPTIDNAASDNVRKSSLLSSPAYQLVTETVQRSESVNGPLIGEGTNWSVDNNNTTQNIISHPPEATHDGQKQEEKNEKGMKNRQLYHERKKDLLEEEIFSSNTSFSCSHTSTKGERQQKYSPFNSPSTLENEKRHKLNAALLRCFSSKKKRVSFSVPLVIEVVADPKTDTPTTNNFATDTMLKSSLLSSPASQMAAKEVQGSQSTYATLKGERTNGLIDNNNKTQKTISHSSQQTINYTDNNNIIVTSNNNSNSITKTSKSNNSKRRVISKLGNCFAPAAE